MMKHKIVSTLLLSAVSLTAFSSNLDNYAKSHADPGVINKAGILYWLEKRGELKPNASEAEKLKAYNNYLGKKSFEPKALPGAFGKKMMLEQQTSFASYHSHTTPSIKMKTKGPENSRAVTNEITDVNVLALLIEFPDHTADKNTYTLDHYTSLLFDKIDANDLNADITSASQYYYLESGGTFNFDGKVNDWPDATWLMADNEAAYYGGNDEETDNDKAVPELIKEAVTKAVAAGLDLSDYDSDNDGVYDGVDRCPSTPAGTQIDETGCAIDKDNDGVINGQDQCPMTPAGAKVDAKGCEVVVKSLDADNDGVLDSNDKCLNTPADVKVDATGCTVVERRDVSVKIEILFPNNSSVVTNPNSSELQELATFMKRFPSTEAVVEGHSSSVGDAQYNLNLSKKRAYAVRKILINDFGLDASRVEAVGYGETRLKDTGDNAAAHRANRRIQVKVTALVDVKK